jgi:hypothetical protein
VELLLFYKPFTVADMAIEWTCILTCQIKNPVLVKITQMPASILAAAFNELI